MIDKEIVHIKKGNRKMTMTSHNWKKLKRKNGWVETAPPTKAGEVTHESKKADLKADLLASMGGKDKADGVVEDEKIVEETPAGKPVVDNASLIAEGKELAKSGRNIEALISFRAAGDLKKTSYGTKMINSLTKIVETATQVNELIASAKDLAALDPESAIEMLTDAQGMATGDKIEEIELLINSLK